MGSQCSIYDFALVLWISKSPITKSVVSRNNLRLYKKFGYKGKWDDNSWDFVKVVEESGKLSKY